MKALSLLILLCASCATSQGYYDQRRDSGPDHTPSIQGFIGVMDMEGAEYDLDPAFGLDGDSDFEQLPTLGFTLVQPFAGDRIQLGIEGGMSVAWENDTATINTGNGLLVLADNDLFIGDGFIGLHAMIPIGERLRVYGGVGPLAQFAHVELEYENLGMRRDLEESAFGVGAYGRVGIEWEVTEGNRFGMFLRRIDSTVDLGGDIDEVDIEATQVVIALSQSF